MNVKDLDDCGKVVYWLAAVRADLEALRDHPGKAKKEYVEYTLGNLKKAEDAVERVASGENRRKRG